MAELVVRNLCRRYGGFKAVDNISFTVPDGKFLTLLGPSGCGKSTTLAMLAGLDRPDEGFIAVGGEVFFDGVHKTFVEAEKRNLGLVFQTYALWPHMTVRQNVEYALKLRQMPRAERAKRVNESLELVEMEKFIDRYPNQLSGGQQQRVALARTLAYRPKLLLLDEPLSNLDAKLRDRARSWLKQLQGQIGITTIFVTHDQSEALSLSDSIAVMDKGSIVQLGSPLEIYDTPATSFVADFIGTSNFFHGTVARTDSTATVIRLSDGQLLTAQPAAGLKVDELATLACRPERIQITNLSSDKANTLRARVIERSYLGARSVFTLEAGRDTFRLESGSDIGNDEIVVELPMDHCVVFRGSAKPAREAHT